jgi:hypothetical protein
MFRSQNDLPNNLEFNFKGLFYDKVWIGGGHRVDYASHIQLGFIMDKLNFGYLYEFPRQKSYLLPNPTHEMMISLKLFKRDTEGLSIW